MTSLMGPGASGGDFLGTKTARTGGSISAVASIAAAVKMAVGTHVAVGLVSMSTHAVARQRMCLAAAQSVHNGEDDDRQPCADSDHYFNNTHLVWTPRHV